MGEQIVVVGAVTRRIANGCLVLLMIPAALLAYFWYDAWHTGHTNGERRQGALSGIAERAHEAADDTSRALTASGPDADADTLTGVIWRHSEAPLITYDSARHEFTATVVKASMYVEEAVFLGGGSEQVARCFRFTFTHGSGSAWTSRMNERDDEVCQSSRQIGSLAASARQDIENMSPSNMTPTGVLRALDSTGTLGYFDVRRAVRDGNRATVTVLIHVERPMYATAQQCYRFVRPLGPDDTGSEVTAVPLAACPTVTSRRG